MFCPRGLHNASDKKEQKVCCVVLFLNKNEDSLYKDITGSSWSLRVNIPALRKRS